MTAGAASGAFLAVPAIAARLTARYPDLGFGVGGM